MKIKPSEVAIIQLDASIAFFQNRSFIPALTLAGAADGIIGPIAKRRTGSNSYDMVIEALSSMCRRDRLPVPPQKTLNAMINGGRNALKHLTSGEDRTIEHDFLECAKTMITRACLDLWRCKIQGTKRIDEWLPLVIGEMILMGKMPKPSDWPEGLTLESFMRLDKKRSG